MTYESRQDYATGNARFWARDAAFWTRYGQHAKACHGSRRHADCLHEVMGYQSHQSEY